MQVCIHIHLRQPCRQDILLKYFYSFITLAQTTNTKKNNNLNLGVNNSFLLYSLKKKAAETYLIQTVAVSLNHTIVTVMMVLLSEMEIHTQNAELTCCSLTYRASFRRHLHSATLLSQGFVWFLFG